MTSTTRLLHNRLKDSSIVWFGSKATDAKHLQGFGKNLSIFSLVGLGKDLDKGVYNFSLEDELKRRIDYDRFSWDELEGKYANKIVNHIRKLTKKEQVVIVPFSSSQFFSNILRNTV